MRSTALITLISSAAMAAPEHTLTRDTSGQGLAYDGIVYAPPVTTTVTETETETTTQYDTITSYETTVTAHHTAYEFVPPVTATVTEYIGELYDQSYDNDYELGDLIVAPTVITETKTFTLAAPGTEEKASTTELVKKWSIAEATPYATTLTQYTSTTWVHEHITSTIWVDAEPTEGPAEEYATKTIELEDGYGGLEEPQTTGSRFHVIDLPDNDEPNDEELTGLLADIWKAEQEAAEKAAQEAAEKIFEEPTKGDKYQEIHKLTVSSSSTSQAHKPSRLHGPTPTHRPSTFHTHSPSFSTKPSTFEIKTSSQAAPSPKPSVSANAWQGKLLNTPNGTCGPKGNLLAFTCQGNSRGLCCSAYGHCGSEPAHCGEGCQSAFGTCSLPASSNKTQPQPQPHGLVKRAEEFDSNVTASVNRTTAVIKAAVFNGSVLAKGTPLAELRLNLTAEAVNIAEQKCSKWLPSCLWKTIADATKDRDGEHSDGSETSDDEDEGTW